MTREIRSEIEKKTENAKSDCDPSQYLYFVIIDLIIFICKVQEKMK